MLSAQFSSTECIHTVQLPPPSVPRSLCLPTWDPGPVKHALPTCPPPAPDASIWVPSWWLWHLWAPQGVEAHNSFALSGQFLAMPGPQGSSLPVSEPFLLSTWGPCSSSAVCEQSGCFHLSEKRSHPCTSHVPQMCFRCRQPRGHAVQYLQVCVRACSFVAPQEKSRHSELATFAHLPLPRPSHLPFPSFPFSLSHLLLSLLSPPSFPALCSSFPACSPLLSLPCTSAVITVCVDSVLTVGMGEEPDMRSMPTMGMLVS